MIEASSTKVWRATLYLRLSKDDNSADKGESNSIQNQRELLLDFVSRNPDISVVNVLADDGFTGANFDRVAFKDMIRHIEDGLIDCVICKDFSRLGREHIETGKYIERYFAAKNVRFIAVNESYDSLKADMTDSSNSLIVPFKNIINEAFLEDISVKTKTQLAIKRKNGELPCNHAVFGYVKQDGKLIVDQYAADVVKSIFDCKIMGYGEAQIATMLDAKGVLPPAEYKKAMGISYNTPFSVNEKSEWSAKAIKRILSNRIYLGHLEQGKRAKTSYRMKQCYDKPVDKWVVHKNSHEAIIDELDFDLAQELMLMDTRISLGENQLRLFAGLIVCGLCGQKMTAQKTKKKSGKIYINYVCSTHKRTGECENNSVSELMLSKLILLAIRNQVENLLSPDDVKNSLNTTGINRQKQAAIENMIEHNLQTIKDNGEYLVKSYEHYLDEIISESEYQTFRMRFNSQIENAEKNIASLRNELNHLGDDTYAKKLAQHFVEHKNITELNRRIVVGLIKNIVVNNGKDINIIFRYSGGYLDRSEEKAVI